MASDSLLDQIWKYKMDSEYAERYWNHKKRFHFVLGLMWRASLAIASLASILAWLVNQKDFVWICTLVSGLAGVFVCVLAPMLKLDSAYFTTARAHSDWRRLARGFASLYEDAESSRAAEKSLSQKFEGLRHSYDYLFTEDNDIAESERFSEMAVKELQDCYPQT